MWQARGRRQGRIVIATRPRVSRIATRAAARLTDAARAGLAWGPPRPETDPLRRLTTPVLLLLAALCPAPAAEAAPIAFVLNSADATISEFDYLTRREIRRLPVLREPHHLALTPDGQHLAVGDTSGNALFFLDPVTGEMQNHITISDPYQLFFSPNGRYLTVAGLARDQIDIYDAHSYQLLHRIVAKSMPSHANYAPDSSVVYVSLQQSGRLMAIETATGRVIWNVPVGSTPAGVLFHNGQILVGVMGTDYVAVVDPADGHTIRQIHLQPGPHNIFLDPGGRHVYVTARVSGYIDQLDPTTLALQHSFRVPGGPDDIVFAPDGKMWATLRWRQHVAVIDPVSGEYTTIATGRSPHGIWLNNDIPRH